MEKLNNYKNVKIIGVGGCGCRNVDLFRETFKKSDYILIDTNVMELDKNIKNIKCSMPFIRKCNGVIIGLKAFLGGGVNNNPDLGEVAALESQQEIEESLQEAELVFIVAGLGGGTGTGASHIIAKCAKDKGATVIGVVTMPFAFEGGSKQIIAMEGLIKMDKTADGMVVFENEDLLKDELSASLSEVIKLKYTNYGDKFRDTLAKIYNR